VAIYRGMPVGGDIYDGVLRLSDEQWEYPRWGWVQNAPEPGTIRYIRTSVVLAIFLPAT
jgi:hypothetical protein